MSLNSPPRLTIGVPAYKNALTLRTSVESLLAQTFGDFRLVISDDNSPDNTQNVAQDLALQDKRILYIRQPRNLKYQNFGFLLRQANTEYFMWAAGDDLWSPEFVRRCIEVLDSRSDIVLATPRIAFLRDGKPNGLSNATYPLTDSVENNIRHYLAYHSDNSRMYGVFRTEAGKKSFPIGSFHAYDIAFSAALLRFGGNAEIPEVLMTRDQTPLERYLHLIREDSNNLLKRCFPYLEMSCWLVSEAKIPLNVRMIASLLALNVNKHIWYTEYFHQRYSNATEPLKSLWRRHIEWRLIKSK